MWSETLGNERKSFQIIKGIGPTKKNNKNIESQKWKKKIGIWQTKHKVRKPQEVWTPPLETGKNGTNTQVFWASNFASWSLPFISNLSCRFKLSGCAKLTKCHIKSGNTRLMAKNQMGHQNKSEKVSKQVGHSWKDSKVTVLRPVESSARWKWVPRKTARDSTMQTKSCRKRKEQHHQDSHQTRRQRQAKSESEHQRTAKPPDPSGQT